MFLNTSITMKIFVLLFVVACVYAQEAPEGKSALAQQIPKTCLGCMCEAASECDTSTGCLGDVCGPFRITWAYWADGGKPTLNNESPNADGAWTRCVNDPFCAANAVQGYMDRFAQDCNGDGVVNCDDFVRIHYLGGNGCNGGLPPKYENAYRTCMNTFSS